MSEETDEPIKASKEESVRVGKIDDPTIDELKEQLEKEKNNVKSCEENLKRSLADFDNLKKRTSIDIETNVNSQVDKLMLEFLTIYDDFIRGKDVLAKQKINVEGLEAIIKNMNALLSEHEVTPIVALGEIFDPIIHEAISVKEDPLLDDGTITNEIRKGYKLSDRILRPSLVEISKKPNTSKEVEDKNG